MYVDPRLAQDVAKAEGCRLAAYRDGGGVLTIGYGHTGPEVTDGLTITQAQADNWLNADLDKATFHAVGLPEWAALDTPRRRNVVVECVFNLGVGHWMGFHQTRAAIQAQQWQSASQNLLDSPTWISQVGLGRVSRLAAGLLSGSY